MRVTLAIGTVVKMTPEGKRAAGGINPDAAGVVMGYSRDGLLVKVKRDGQKSTSTYSTRFWVAAEGKDLI